MGDWVRYSFSAVGLFGRCGRCGLAVGDAVNLADVIKDVRADGVEVSYHARCAPGSAPPPEQADAVMRESTSGWA